MEIRWKGESGHTGYGTASYFYIKTLRELGIKVAFEGILLSERVSPEHQELLETNPKVDEDSLLVDHTFGNVTVNAVKYMVVEGMKLPFGFAQDLNDALEIWTASRFCKETFIYSGVSKRIEVIPHGVDSELFNPNAEPLYPSKRFTFLLCSNYALRKNLRGAVRAFAREFSGEERVRLLIKTNKEGKLLIEGLPSKYLEKVEIISDSIPYTKMANFYTSGNVSVLYSFGGEGWALPLSEGGACQIPPIVPRWGGPPEYLGDYAFYIPINKVGFPLKDGIPWGEASKLPFATPEDDLFFNFRVLMRTAYENPDLVRYLGRKLRKRLLGYTWKSPCERIVKRLEELA